jgi:prevent-host-death family protein
MDMAISVTNFKNSCLDVIRRVEKTGRAISITRRGKVVARISPSLSAGKQTMSPLEQLRSMGNRLVAEPGESVVQDKDFEALRCRRDFTEIRRIG